MRVVGLITARGGSKGLPGKNIAPLAGKPMIVWTIEAALASQELGRTIVSTDSEEIADVAKAAGVEVPFLRPKALSADDTPHTLVMQHAIEWFERDEGCLPDYLVLLQPTSPCRIASDIDRASQIAKVNRADSVISVTETHHHPFWMRRLTAEGRLDDLVPAPAEGLYMRRQDMPRAMVFNGAVYVIRGELVKSGAGYGNTAATYGYEMPPDRSIDVDTAWDLKLAALRLAEEEQRK